MIFITWEQVLGLKLPAKGQTRRPVKEGQEANRWDIETDVINEVIRPSVRSYDTWQSVWVVGHTYAVQPGRGKPAVWWRPDGSATPTPLDEYLQKTESGARALWGPKVKAWLRDHGYREARIEVKKIGRESLQDISEEDCIAEGVQVRDLWGLDYIPAAQSLGDDRYFTEDRRLAGLRGAFALLWDSIYPKVCNWLENPKVWVLDFQMERSET